MEPKTFSTFTNLYSLSKTLRFELKPIGSTLNHMRSNFQWDEKLQTFFKDQEIEDAYNILKPVIDFLHEQFITESLETAYAQSIDFSEYLEKYRNKVNLTDSNLETSEKLLRSCFEKAYQEASEKLKRQAGKNEKDKNILEKDGYKILREEGILNYIRRNVAFFSSIQKEEEIKRALECFKGFFTYFTGFNQNRENYYATKEEKATSVATRIVHENLPKFCDNILAFESHRNEYENVYSFLQSLNRNLVDKDGRSLFTIEDKIFDIGYFNQCLSQKQIEDYNYRIGNANFLINLYNQVHYDNKAFKKLTKFKTLYKQIGCGKRRSLFFTLTCDTKAEAENARNENKEALSVEKILHVAKLAGEKYFQDENKSGILDTVPEFICYISARKDYKGVYWSKAALNTISNKYFANYHDLKDRLMTAKVFKKNAKGSMEDIKIPEAISLEELFAVINEVDNWKEEGVFFKKSLTEKLKDEKEDYKNQKRQEIIKKAEKPSQALLLLIFSDVSEHIGEFFDASETVTHHKEYNSKESKEIIKAWLDHALAINQILKYFFVRENKIKGGSLDPEISNALKVLLFEGEVILEDEKISVEWFKWYDALRNYLTKKSQDDVKENKLKLNFENSTVAAGWDLNKEPENYCTILQDQQGKQYLTIIAKQEKQKGYNKIFEKSPENPLYKVNGTEIWQKMEYKQIAAPTGIGGFVRKCFNTAQQYGWNCPGNCLNNEGKIIIKNDEAKANLKAIIDCYKDFFNKYEKDGFRYEDFNFKFNESGEYRELKDFFDDVKKQGYKLDFVDINKSYLDQLVEDGKIYLFEIKNQDSNCRKKEGHLNNLHTMYWKTIFENAENRPKLNGGAEIFYRKAVPSNKQEIVKDRSGKDIIKNYRFSKEKFLFHIPITLNFCLKNRKINDLINKEFISSEDIFFLGIDRGEKHLVYYSLVNQNGKMVCQGTFNTINGHDYRLKLDELEKNRQEARKNWQTIGTIRELKEGYISQVVKVITDTAVRQNAVIVLEDLNTGFKRGRQKIEKSVYQNFELALAKKLNFLVDKSAKAGEIGSVTKALQLTPPVNNYGDIENRKQVGIMLYTRANYTSQTDPISGWRKTIYLKKGSEESIKKEISDIFSSIGFDNKDYYFEYKDKNTDKLWRLYSGQNGKSLDRFRGSRGEDKNEWIIKAVNVVEVLDQVFKNVDKKRLILPQIIDEGIPLEKYEGSPHSAWESLRYAIDMIQQIRNTGGTDRDSDFILSPVRDQNGRHFDSRLATHEYPINGDANGAYNIARKGIIMSEHIRRGYTLWISDIEWDLWLSGKDKWEKWLLQNKEKLKKNKNHF